MRLRMILTLSIFGLFPAGIVRAQQPYLAQQPGPWFVGEPVVVQVILEDVQSAAEPVCTLAGDIPEGLRIQGPQTGRSVSSFLQSINCRVTRRETASYRFSFAVTAERTGDFTVGPFSVELDGRPLSVGSTQLKIQDLPADPDMEISVSLPAQVLYVGQQVPLQIRWAYAGDLQEVQQLFSALQIRSPLFDQFEFEDVAPRTPTRLTLATARGGVSIDAEVERESRGGRDYIVVKGSRLMTLDRPAEYEMVPVTCRTEKVTSWGRNLFGDRVARSTSPVLAAGKPLSFSVRSLPAENRPESFSGAVGQGFSIAVAANRTVVRVGDPITLDVTVRGQGNLQQLMLPPLSADGGLSESDFQLPQERPLGTSTDGARQFKVTVRAEQETVQQIPPVAFSWFDPQQQKYLTTRSAPVAMQVLPAQVISASDVVGGATDSGTAGVASDDSAARTALTFSGANLAIEKDPAVLLALAAAENAGEMLPALIYALGITVVILAVVTKRRSHRDPLQWERDQRIRRARQSIVESGSLRGAESAAQVARALRQLLGYCTGEVRQRADRLIAECETRIYDRSGQAGQPEQSLVDAALKLVDQLL